MSQPQKQASTDPQTQGDSSFQAHDGDTLRPDSSSGQLRSAERLASAGAPERIARYRIDGVLGEGGFGRVFLAFDEELNRNVAIKVPLSQCVANRADADLYVAEARTLASLDHPAIVPVFDVGRTDDGLCYVVSKLIEGDDLAGLMKDQRLTHAESARLVATVAEALHHAHKKGLVHRDIKPANILIDQEGQPFVADFGLALKEEDLGKGHGWAGTPVYMSPEQARGEGNKVDGRSDIFSLGAVFYELLTGRRPFSGNSADDIMQHIASVAVRPPRQRDDTISVELERICLKALALDMSLRYTTARDLAADLRAYLEQSGAVDAATDRYSSRNSSAVDDPRQLPTERGSSTATSPAREPASARNSKRPLVIAGVGIALILAAAPVAYFASRPSETPAVPPPWTPQYTDVKPKIIGIYPNDAFGPLRKQGLHAFTDEHPEIRVIDLDSVTIAQMKQADIEPLLRELADIIENDNVLAIVGPPITESTKLVLRTVADSGKRIPVIVESAGAPGEIGWTEFGDRVPIFRISSGIDRRAAEIALFIKESLQIGRPVHLLIEQQPGAGGRRTYGEHIYEEIKRHLNELNVDARNLDAEYFPTADIGAVMPRVEQLASEPGVILMLGLGNHYLAIAEQFYMRDAESSPRPQARLVGWMNSYRTDAELRTKDFDCDMLYEITDFDINDRGPRPALFDSFQREFGEANPAVRDQAFSFDSGVCLVQAYRSVVEREFEQRSGYYPLIDDHARELVERELRSTLFHGITGDIRFGEAGQNLDGRLDYARFDKAGNRWIPVNYKELLRD